VCGYACLHKGLIRSEELVVRSAAPVAPLPVNMTGATRALVCDSGLFDTISVKLDIALVKASFSVQLT
jgi:hypothetical protein